MSVNIEELTFCDSVWIIYTNKEYFKATFVETE